MTLSGFSMTLSGFMTPINTTPGIPNLILKRVQDDSANEPTLVVPNLIRDLDFGS